MVVSAKLVMWLLPLRIFSLNVNRMSRNGGLPLMLLAELERS